MKYLKLNLLQFSFLPLVFILFTATCFAQNTGIIKGAIQTSDNKPAEGVSITVKELNRTTIADNNGFFTIKSLANGTYTLILTLVGYNDVEQKVNVVSGETTSAN